MAFHRSYAFGGFLYVLMGQEGTSADPFDNDISVSAGLTDVAHFAPIRAGVVGPWDPVSPGSGVKERTKHNVLAAFDRVFIYEGLISSGNIANFEGERSEIDPATGKLPNFNGLTGSNVPGLAVYNAAGVVSPLSTAIVGPSGGNPQFLLIGGQTSPTALSAATRRTTFP